MLFLDAFKSYDQDGYVVFYKAKHSDVIHVDVVKSIVSNDIRMNKWFFIGDLPCDPPQKYGNNYPVHFANETNTAMYCGMTRCNEIQVDIANIQENPIITRYNVLSFGAYDMYFNNDNIVILNATSTDKYKRIPDGYADFNTISFGGTKFAKGSAEKNAPINKNFLKSENLAVNEGISVPVYGNGFLWKLDINSENLTGEHAHPIFTSTFDTLDLVDAVIVSRCKKYISLYNKANLKLIHRWDAADTGMKDILTWRKKVKNDSTEKRMVISTLRWKFMVAQKKLGFLHCHQMIKNEKGEFDTTTRVIDLAKEGHENLANIDLFNDEFTKDKDTFMPSYKMETPTNSRILEQSSVEEDGDILKNKDRFVLFAIVFVSSAVLIFILFTVYLVYQILKKDGKEKVEDQDMQLSDLERVEKERELQYHANLD